MKLHDRSNIRAGVFKQSMGARIRVGVGLSYRAARLHRLAELIPGLLRSLKILAQVRGGEQEGNLLRLQGRGGLHLPPSHKGIALVL
jgi:hypothetical protein